MWMASGFSFLFCKLISSAFFFALFSVIINYIVGCINRCRGRKFILHFSKKNELFYENTIVLPKYATYTIVYIR
jgi:hypothetical protein